MKVSRRNISGFSLFELVVVIVIVGILSAVAIPSYISQTTKARRADAKATLLDLAQRQERFRSERGSYGSIQQITGVANYDSPEGHYNITVVPAVGGGQVYTLTATAQNAQANDAVCGNFTLTDAGIQGITGPAANLNICWN